jgi:hypothetical protein
MAKCLANTTLALLGRRCSGRDSRSFRGEHDGGGNGNGCWVNSENYLRDKVEKSNVSLATVESTPESSIQYFSTRFGGVVSWYRIDGISKKVILKFCFG